MGRARCGDHHQWSVLNGEWRGPSSERKEGERGKEGGEAMRGERKKEEKWNERAGCGGEGMRKKEPVCPRRMNQAGGSLEAGVSGRGGARKVGLGRG